MKRRKGSGSLKRRTGFLCVWAFFAASFAFAEDCSVILGQQRLSNLFFPGQAPVRTWFRGFGNWTNISSGNVDAKSYGVSLGADRQIGRNFLVGAGLGGSWSSAEEKQWNEKLDVSAFHGSLYARIRLQRLYFDLEGGLGFNDQQPSTAFQSHLGGEIGTWWEQGLARVEPYFGVRQLWYDGKPLRTGEKTTSVLGVRYSWKTTTALAVTTPRIYGGWLHEWNDRDLIGVGSFVDAPTVYRFNGATLPTDRFFAGGGFTTALGSSLDVYLRYTAEIAPDFSAHTLLLGMNWNF